MVGMDEPEHGRHRALVSKAFSPKALARWETDLVGRVGNELIDRFAGQRQRGSGERIHFSLPEPVIAGLLGLPQEDYRAVSALVDLVAGCGRQSRSRPPRRQRRWGLPRADPCGPPSASPATISPAAWPRPRSTERSSPMRRSTAFCTCCCPPGSRPRTARWATCCSGCCPTPTNSTRSAPTAHCFPQAIEEAVRWERAAASITRVATRDTELAGVPIPAGSSVMPMLGAANRARGPLPRPRPLRHLPRAAHPIAWGHGPHVCLGMHLARMEMRVAVNVLLDRLPNLRLDPDGNDPHIRGQVFRSPTSLPVVFGAPTGSGS